MHVKSYYFAKTVLIDGKEKINASNKKHCNNIPFFLLLNGELHFWL